jgi:two-component system response regulator RegA
MDHRWDERNSAVLLVDDSDVFRGRLAKALRERGLEVATAANAEEALDVLKTRRFDRAILDLKMPGRSGLALLKSIREHDPAVRVVILTGFGSIATAVEAMRLGAVNFVSKPADADDVLAAFEVDKVSESPAEPEMEVQSLARAEWEHIQRVLVECGGNISEAARRLGIHRRSLQRKLQKLAP